MIKKNLEKLNSATKYPSIPTYHEIGDKGILKEIVQVSFRNGGYFSEKIDGTNARIILFPDKGYYIGSREDLLTASGDLIYNPAQNIVEAVRPIITQIKVPDKSVYIFYGEVYGAKINNGKNYTQSGKVGFRLFDIATFMSEYDFEEFLKEKIDEIARWREHGGQTFLCESDLMKIAENSNIPVTPRLSTKEPIPEGIPETLEWLKKILPGNTNASLDGPGGKPEGVVVRTFTREKIAKIRFEDYERTLRGRK
jgi:hypothetical protein